jgi:hypothetical protein
MTIKHVVVVMLENRSFDNVLSALKGTPPTHTNEGPAGSVATHAAAAKRIGDSGATYAGTTLPLIDPGEKTNEAINVRRRREAGNASAVFVHRTAVL